MFDELRHRQLIELLAKAEYVSRYLDFCAKYPAPAAIDLDQPRIDLAAVHAIFRNLGVKTTWHKRFKTFEFAGETIAGWEWKGSLVIQRYDGLEPMMEGRKGKCAVGSTLLKLACDAGDLRDPPIKVTAPAPRPNFDGDMRTMERVVPDLVALFRSVKDAIRDNWCE
jgi:hypothetical protein